MLKKKKSFLLFIVILLCFLLGVLARLIVLDVSARSLVSSKQPKLLAGPRSATSTGFVWSSAVDKAVPASTAVATYTAVSNDNAYPQYLSPSDGVLLISTTPASAGYSYLNWNVGNFNFAGDFRFIVTFIQSGSSGMLFGLGGSGPFSSGVSTSNGGLAFSYNLQTSTTAFTLDGSVSGNSTSFDAGINYKDLQNSCIIDVRTFGGKRKVIVSHGQYRYVMNCMNLNNWVGSGSVVCVGATAPSSVSNTHRIQYVSLEKLSAGSGNFCWDAAADGAPTSDAVATVSTTSNDSGYPVFSNATQGMLINRAQTGRIGAINWEMANFDFGSSDFRLRMSIFHNDKGQGIMFSFGGSGIWSDFGTTNGSICYRLQSNTVSSVWYKNGVQQGSFLPFHDTSGIQYLGKFVDLVFEARTVNGKRTGTVYYSRGGGKEHAIDLTGWIPAGKFFAVGSRTGSSSTATGVHYVRHVSLEYI